MAGASDKARFYLEQSVPELQEYARKEIFTPTEISSIAAKRSDFEHILNARGSKPADYVRYATYEMNLDALRKKRCKRLGVKGIKNHSGQRTIFFILDRATKKFPGDMGLWMQYIQFCQSEGASKKLNKVLTSVLRLKPREWGLWVLATKWYAEQQGDMSTARSYMQRGLRFCKEERKLWLEYAKLEMVYLAKLAARRKILGLDEPKPETTEEADENMIVLPTVTAADIAPEASKGIEEVNAVALERLAKAPAFTGALPRAIFDAAMKHFHNSPEAAEAFFDLVSTFDQVPSSRQILQHILTHLQTTSPTSPEAIICEARLSLFDCEYTSSAFPTSLGQSLACVQTGLGQASDKQKPLIAEKASLMLLPILVSGVDLDQDVQTVVVASIHRYLRVLLPTQTRARSEVVRALLDAIRSEGKLTVGEIMQVVADSQNGPKA